MKEVYSDLEKYCKVYPVGAKEKLGLLGPEGGEVCELYFYGYEDAPFWAVISPSRTYAVVSYKGRSLKPVYSLFPEDSCDFADMLDRSGTFDTDVFVDKVKSGYDYLEGQV